MINHDKMKSASNIVIGDCTPEHTYTMLSTIENKGKQFRLLHIEFDIKTMTW